MQEVVARPDHPVEARLGEADGLQVIGLLALGQDGDLALDFGGNHNSDRALARRPDLHRLRQGVAVGGRGLLDVAHIEHRLGRQESERLEEVVLLTADAGGAGRAALLEFGQRPLGQRQQLFGLLVVALGLLLHRQNATLEAFEVSQHQFGLDRLDVGERINTVLDMGDVAVLEAAHDMGDRVAFADIGEELVAEALAFRRAAHEARDIDEGQAGRDDLLRAGDPRQHREPRVRHRNVAHIGLDGAERIIGRLSGSRLRQSIEKRGFADIRQAHDAAFETHGEGPDLTRALAMEAGLWGPRRQKASGRVSSGLDPDRRRFVALSPDKRREGGVGCGERPAGLRRLST